MNNEQGNIVIYQTEDGKTYQTQFYNLDAIISVGYRIKSIVATHFRRWATERLKEKAKKKGEGGE